MYIQICQTDALFLFFLFFIISHKEAHKHNKTLKMSSRFAFKPPTPGAPLRKRGFTLCLAFFPLVALILQVNYDVLFFFCHFKVYTKTN